MTTVRDPDSSPVWAEAVVTNDRDKDTLYISNSKKFDRVQIVVHIDNDFKKAIYFDLTHAEWRQILELTSTREIGELLGITDIDPTTTN